MTTRVRVSGTLVQAPESRALKAGRANATAATATLKSKDGNHTQFWRIAAFSEPVQVELMRLTARDAVAVEGALKAELYDRDGEIELLFGVIAEHVLPLRQPGHKRTKEGRAATQGADATWPPKFLQRECRSRHRSCHFPESSSL
jgi:single-stranded DNA-binding protein